MFGRRQIIASVISLLALVAMSVSAYLTWTIWQSEVVVGCTGDTLLDCEDVLTSRWSKWLNLPVSLLGALTYFGILCLVWPAAQRPRTQATPALFSLVMLAVGAAAWFIGLQVIQLESYCTFCLTVHCCGLVIGIMTLLLVLQRTPTNDYGQMRSLLGVADESFEETAETSVSISGPQVLTAVLISVVGIAALMGGQLLVEPTQQVAMEEVELKPTPIESPVENSEEVTEAIDTTTPPEPEVPAAGEFAIATDQPEDTDDDYSWLESDDEESSKFEVIPDSSPSVFETDDLSSIFEGGNRRSFQGLAEPVDLPSMPMLGNSNAQYVFVEMMDYTCPHCRHLHPHIHAALERYGDQIGVVIHHVPLSKKCSPFVKKDYPGKKYSCDYAQLAIGVWKLAPQEFPAFHDWLLEEEKPPLISKARRRAMGLVGDAILLDKQLKLDTSKRLAEQSRRFQQLNTGLPVLLFHQGALRGVPEESEKLFEYLETTLGVVPP